MCIGIPMQIKEQVFGSAICEGMGHKREVDTLLVGEQPIGTWLLVFLNSAREILTEEEATKIMDAVKAIDIVMSNGGQISQNGMDSKAIEALFSDLIDREPQKPESLIAFEKSQIGN